jgi:hypothetical protein
MAPDSPGKPTVKSRETWIYLWVTLKQLQSWYGQNQAQHNPQNSYLENFVAIAPGKARIKSQLYLFPTSESDCWPKLRQKD